MCQSFHAIKKYFFRDPSSSWFLHRLLVIFLIDLWWFDLDFFFFCSSSHLLGFLWCELSEKINFLLVFVRHKTYSFGRYILMFLNNQYISIYQVFLFMSFLRSFPFFYSFFIFSASCFFLSKYFLLCTLDGAATAARLREFEKITILFTLVHISIFPVVL